MNILAKLEVATEHSRELDGEIWCAANHLTFVMWDGAGCVWKEDPQGRASIRHEPAEKIKPYSRSVDAALSLVPEGMGGMMMWDDRPDKYQPEALIDLPNGDEIRTQAKTLALALCIAALKARQAVT